MRKIAVFVQHEEPGVKRHLKKYLTNVIMVEKPESADLVISDSYGLIGKICQNEDITGFFLFNPRRVGAGIQFGDNVVKFPFVNGFDKVIAIIIKRLEWWLTTG